MDSPRQRARWSVRAGRREREGEKTKARVDSTRPGDEAVVAVAASAGALHRVCLARAALPVRHDGGVDAADAHVVERWGEARARDVVVARARVENRVKGEGGGRGVLRGGGVGGGGGRGGDDADLARVGARVHGGGRAAGAGGVARRAHAAHDARVARAAHRARAGVTTPPAGAKLTLGAKPSLTKTLRPGAQLCTQLDTAVAVDSRDSTSEEKPRRR